MGQHFPVARPTTKMQPSNIFSLTSCMSWTKFKLYQNNWKLFKINKFFFKFMNKCIIGFNFVIFKFMNSYKKIINIFSFPIFIYNSAASHPSTRSYQFFFIFVFYKQLSCRSPIIPQLNIFSVIFYPRLSRKSSIDMQLTIYFQFHFLSTTQLQHPSARHWLFISPTQLQVYPQHATHSIQLPGYPKMRIAPTQFPNMKLTPT